MLYSISVKQNPAKRERLYVILILQQKLKERTGVNIYDVSFMPVTIVKPEKFDSFYLSYTRQSPETKAIEPEKLIDEEICSFNIWRDATLV